MKPLKGGLWLVIAVAASGCMPALHYVRPAAYHAAPPVVMPAPVEPLPVRSEEAWILALLDDGILESSTFARLVREVGQYQGIVYVQIGRCPVPGLKGCLLHVIHDAKQVRYLWIRLEPTEDRVALASTLAHELQHAVEVLEHPSIRTSREILLFYRSIDAEAFGGAQGPFRSYETAAAIAVGYAVRAELNAHAAAAFADDRER